jgi:hypothetical protein
MMEDSGAQCFRAILANLSDSRHRHQDSRRDIQASLVQHRVVGAMLWAPGTARPSIPMNGPLGKLGAGAGLLT